MVNPCTFPTAAAAFGVSYPSTPLSPLLNRFAYTAPTTLIPTVPPIERNKAKVAVEVAMSFCGMDACRWSIGSWKRGPTPIAATRR